MNKRITNKNFGKEKIIDAESSDNEEKK